MTAAPLDPLTVALKQTMEAHLSLPGLTDAQWSDLAQILTERLAVEDRARHREHPHLPGRIEHLIGDAELWLFRARVAARRNRPDVALDYLHNATQHVAQARGAAHAAHEEA